MCTIEPLSGREFDSASVAANPLPIVDSAGADDVVSFGIAPRTMITPKRTALAMTIQTKILRTVIWSTLPATRVGDGGLGEGCVVGIVARRVPGCHDGSIRAGGAANVLGSASECLFTASSSCTVGGRCATANDKALGSATMASPADAKRIRGSLSTQRKNQASNVAG